MILSFKPHFIAPILTCTKIHTVRKDKTNLWRPGMKIHFSTGIRSKKYRCFYEGVCTSVQRVFIDPEEGQIMVERMIQAGIGFLPVSSWEFSKNDGFKTDEEFWDWFDTPFAGKIIHWTDFKYE